MASSSFNEYIKLNGVWNKSIISYTGSVMGCISLDGLDPTTMDEEKYKKTTYIVRSLLQTLPPDISITEIYIHSDKNKIELKDRDNKRSNKISKGREKFLNNKRLNFSKIFWIFEVESGNNLNKVLSIDFLKNIFNAIVDKSARETLKSMFSREGAFIVEQKEIDRQEEILDISISNLISKFDIVGINAKKLEIDDFWRLMKTIINLDSSYLFNKKEQAPVSEWDLVLPDGDLEPLRINGIDFIKVNGVEPSYARIASVTSYGKRIVPYAVWGRGSRDTKISYQDGSYIIIKKFKKLSPLKKTLMLQNKSNELVRQQIKISDFMKGNNVGEKLEENVKIDKKTKELADELQQASDTDDAWGYTNTSIIVFGENPEEIKNVSKGLNERATAEQKVSLVWESAGLVNSFINSIPGNFDDSARSVLLNTTQSAASSLIYRLSDGIKVWGDKKEEALLVLETEDKKPFHFTPFIGDKFLLIGVGPTRSGKTYLKQVIASHFMKFGALYHAIDIDAGSEKTAKFFQDDAAIFRADATTGFNPLVSAGDNSDLGFIAHLIRQIKHMLTMNDANDLKILTSDEQEELDEAIGMVLKEKDESFRNFVSIYEHCSDHLKKKLSRFVKGGMYSGIIDREIDAIGSMNKPMNIYNLSGVKDNEGIFKLVQNEVFYRITKIFENPSNLSKVKYMDIDECQYLFQIPGSAEIVAAKARTWFKHNGGIGLWTQSAEHYLSIPEWSTLKSSATTFWFMSDPLMDKEKYKEAFDLSDGECEVIKNLIPRQQAFIKQPEAGIATVVNINAEPEADVIATSRPSETLIINKVFDEMKECPVDEIIDVCVQRIQEARNS